MYLYLDQNFEFIFYMNIFVDWYIASFEIEKKKQNYFNVQFSMKIIHQKYFSNM